MVEGLVLVFVIGVAVMVIALRFKNPVDHDDCDCHHDHK
jgi:hypothetical protein